MTATRPPEGDPEISYPTMSDFMANISAEQDPKTRPDGGSTSLNALAFSTLLSSQETDAHRQVSLRFPVGATLKHYPRVSFVSTSFPEAFQKVADSRILRPQVTSLQRLPCTHVSSESKLLGGSPGPGPPCGVPSPSGQDELYGSGEPSSNRGLYPRCTPSQSSRFAGPAGRHFYVGSDGATVVWEVLLRETARR